MTQDERNFEIWSINAWVGMNQGLSAEVRAEVFRVALRDVLPDVTEREVGYALGLVGR